MAGLLFCALAWLSVGSATFASIECMQHVGPRRRHSWRQFSTGGEGSDAKQPERRLGPGKTLAVQAGATEGGNSDNSSSRPLRCRGTERSLTDDHPEQEGERQGGYEF